jgi:hypothetical protein
MNTADALKLIVKSAPGGIECVAIRVGKNPETLRKELSGSDPKFKMGESTAQLISETAIEEGWPNCYAYVNAVAAGAGRFIELPVRDMAVPKQDLRADMAAMLKECSDAVIALTTALADDAISDNELRTIQREVGELLSKSQDVLRGAAENNAAGKPSHLRAA